MECAIFAACPQATINKFCLLRVSKSWTWRHQQTFHCFEFLLNKALSCTCKSMIVSCKSYFVESLLGLCFYIVIGGQHFKFFRMITWHVVNQKCGVLTKLWRWKNTLYIYISVSSLDDLIRCKTFTDWLEIWSEGSRDTNLKTMWGFSLFKFDLLQWSPM